MSQYTGGSFTTSIYDEINDTELAVKVSYIFYSGCCGSRDRFGAPLEPDDEPELEIRHCERIDTRDEIWNDLPEKIKARIFDEAYTNMHKK